MKGLEAARDLLPFWVVWGPVLFGVPLVFLLSLGSAWAGAALALRPLRQGRDQPWVEQARLAYPGRLVAGRDVLLLPLLLGTFALFRAGPICPVSPLTLALLAALAACIGASLARLLVERRVQPARWRLGDRVRSELAVWIVFNAWVIVLVVVLAYLPDRASPRLWVVLALGGLGMAFCGWGGGLFLARALGLARPAADRLRAVVEQAAATAGVKPRATYELDWSSANALAFPLLGRLAFTPAALAALDDNELRAVCAHELGHLAEPKLAALARVLPLALLLVLAAGWPISNSFGFETYVGLAVAALIILVLLRRLVQRLESRADRLARAQEGEAGTYARALARLYEVNLIPVVQPGRGSSHPHLYDRLIAVGAPPEYARPSPPGRLRIASGLFLSLGLVVLACGLLLLGRYAARDNEQVLFWSVALGGGGAVELSDLALIRYHSGEPAVAVTLYQAGAEADPRSAYYPANEAIVLAGLGRCDEAQRAVGEAQGRMAANRFRPDEIEVVALAARAVRGCRQAVTIP